MAGAGLTAASGLGHWGQEVLGGPSTQHPCPQASGHQDGAKGTANPRSCPAAPPGQMSLAGGTLPSTRGHNWDAGERVWSRGARGGSREAKDGEGPREGPIRGRNAVPTSPARPAAPQLPSRGPALQP